MTGLGLDAVRNALRVLEAAGWIEGMMVAEFPHPVRVTGIRYH